MATIDADAHVIESDETWRYIPNEKLRPFLISPGAGRPQNWLIDGRVFNRGVNFDRNLPVDICEMRDIKSRLKHMDQLDIDVQVLYPSLFLRPLTARAEVENAICRSYNQWLIDVCARGEGRLKWIAVVPVIDAASMNGNGKRDKRETVTEAWQRLGLLKPGQKLTSAAYQNCIKDAAAQLVKQGLLPTRVG